ncbi:MAG: hypothetical protein AMXMBFR33_62160 [Candidatus Xenobia bacterium]
MKLKAVRRVSEGWILTIALTLVTLGTLLVFSSSAVMTASSPDFRNDPYFFLKRQLIYLCVGLIAMMMARKVDLLRYRWLTSLPFTLCSLTLLAAVLAVGPEINGAQRWILLGPFQFQPAELAKLAMIFYLADALERRRDRVTSFGRLVPALAIFGATMLLVELEPDLGTGLVIAAVFMGMLFVAGARVEHLGGMAIAGVLAVCAMILAKPYRMQRLATFLDPMADTQDSGYQLFQSLLALASGGIWGQGLGESHQKYNYLPEMHTDFIFAILGEELGLMGGLAVLTLFLCFLYKGFKVAVNCRRPYLRLLAVGVTFQISFQAIMNVAVVSGAIPSTGIPLPFISYGGTSLLFSLINIGILLNIADYNKRQLAFRDRPQKERRRMRRGSTLSSSNEETIGSVSKGDWEKRAAGNRLKSGSSGNLPRPPIEPGLADSPGRLRRRAEALAARGHRHRVS